VAVFTQYDVLVNSLKPQAPDEDDFYRDIEEDIENLDKGVDPIMASIAGTSASQTDQYVLSRAKERLREMVMPLEERLGVPWVKVSGLHACLSF